MSNRSTLLIFRILLVAITANLLLTQSSALAMQGETLEPSARALLENMSVRQRVGQLFLVTFEGNGTEADSEIVDLITNYHVGGVVLRAENNNIDGIDNTPLRVAGLVRELQSYAIAGQPSITISEVLTAGTPLPTVTPESQVVAGGVPLFIALAHEGDGPPYTEIRHGLTALPNAMTIGATWDPQWSEIVGEVAGRELESLGINMLLGPSLDVLENPAPLSSSDLGTRSFGGDPYWVGLMGQAYIRGIHQGSSGRIAVIARHFPGYGSSDRPINVEVGTVRKSLEQLKQIELAPFFTVTADVPGTIGSADGLLTAHVRYQGFQGNIRATTAPVSFDPQALSTLLELPEFATWRANFGLIVSDELGVRAVKRFYDDTEQEFPHRQIARDALFAGNDVLFTSNFSLQDRDFSAHYRNIRDTIEWFAGRYESDQIFRERIDDALVRILVQKLRLYQNNFEYQDLAPLDSEVLELQTSEDALFDIGQDAITLIAPTSGDVSEQFPPTPNDDIVIFTDSRSSRQCGACPDEPYIGVNEIEQRLLALYGPQSTQQVQVNQIASFTFEQLKEALLQEPGEPGPEATAAATPIEGTEGSGSQQADNTPTPSPTPSVASRIEEELADAEWVLFALLRPDPQIESSDALSLFLEERPDIARNANIVVYAFNAPYYIDTTEISKLTAYYGIYSKGNQFIDAAIRTLFESTPFTGRSPVSIPAVGYDLFQVTKPDPDQVLELYILDEGIPMSPPSQAPLEVVPGATLRLQTGVIRDLNGNPVPDGTPVQFIQQDRLQGFISMLAERPTVSGIANFDYLLEARTGNFRITAVAGDATASQEVDIVLGENAIVSVSTPTATQTAIPTDTPQPSATATPTRTPTRTPTPTPEPTEVPQTIPDFPDTGLNLGADKFPLLLNFFAGLIVTGVGAYLFARRRGDGAALAVRLVLLSLAGSLIVYNYFLLGLPGSSWLVKIVPWSGLVSTLIGGAIVLLASMTLASPGDSLE